LRAAARADDRGGSPLSTSTAITSEPELEALLGAPMEFVRMKVRDRLDDAMRTFIDHSPLAFISTIDEHGHVDVSPKGDPPGFVQVDDQGDLMIPERLGNRLTFGFRNILRNPEMGLLFVVPTERETLRVKGRASLHHDPDVLAAMAVGGKPALMYTRVRVQKCFFHCGKALIRSKLWQPDTWGEPTRSLGARGFAALAGQPDEETVAEISQRLEQSYCDELY
jgi:PPOX class probable FMN-dependent enzyme